MRWKVLASFWLASLVGIISGCSTGSGLYWGWHCEGDPRTGAWECEQRLMKDGQLVDQSQFAVDDIPPAPEVTDTPPLPPGQAPVVATELAVAPVSATQPPPSLPLPPQDDWKRQLPGMDGSPVEPTVTPEPRHQETLPDQEPAPAPIPEAYTAPVFGSADSAVAAPAATAPGASANPPSAEAAAPVAAIATTSAVSGNGFTLQLAALASEAELEQFIAEHQLSSESLSRHYVHSRGRNWHVLTMGQYASRAAAEQVGGALADRHSGLGYWVRSVASLNAATP